MWCTSSRTQNEMALVSIWDVLAFDVKRLHRICKRVPRMPRACRYPTRPSKRTKYDSKPWPFSGWALDLIGEIHPKSSKVQRYILVGIDYFTKWVEAIPLANVDQEAVIEFIQKHIIYRFGIPESITTDQGSVFTGRKMQDFAKEIGFKLFTSTPYYAQANGQVEAA